MHSEPWWGAGFLPAKRMAWERRAALAQQLAQLQGAAAGQAAPGPAAAPTPNDLRLQALASFIGSNIQVYITSAEVRHLPANGGSAPCAMLTQSTA